HVQAGQLGEGVDDLFGDALTEILELGIAAQVCEWQNRDRLASLALGGGFLARRQGRGELGGRREPIRRRLGERGQHGALQRVRHGRPDAADRGRSVRPTVTDALERAVLTALAKAPADRFATAAQFAAALTAREEPTTEGEGGESIAVLPFANLSGDPEF